MKPLFREIRVSKEMRNLDLINSLTSQPLTGKMKQKPSKKKHWVPLHRRSSNTPYLRAKRRVRDIYFGRG